MFFKKRKKKEYLKKKIDEVEWFVKSHIKVSCRIEIRVDIFDLV